GRRRNAAPGAEPMICASEQQGERPKRWRPSRGHCWNKRDARATAALRLRIDPTVIPQGGTTRDCRILCNSMQPDAPVAKMQFQLGSRTGNQCNIVARVDAITLQI